MGDNSEPENPVEEVADDVTETVVEPAVETAEENVSTDRPPWVDEIIDAVHNVAQPVVETVEEVHDETPNPETPEVPGHGEPIEDMTPTSKPWTHRNPFRRG